MKWMDDFFTITGAKQTPGIIEASLHINPEHPVFNGHFPELPIVPGVCMLQIVLEVIEDQLGIRTFISEAKNLKFVTVLNPQKNNQVSLRVSYTEEDQRLVVNAVLFEGELVFFKLVNATLHRLQ